MTAAIFFIELINIANSHSFCNSFVTCIPCTTSNNSVHLYNFYYNDMKAKCTQEPPIAYFISWSINMQFSHFCLHDFANIIPCTGIYKIMLWAHIQGPLYHGGWQLISFYYFHLGRVWWSSKGLILYNFSLGGLWWSWKTDFGYFLWKVWWSWNDWFWTILHSLSIWQF